jgi:hypothetical protein
MATTKINASHQLGSNTDWSASGGVTNVKIMNVAPPVADTDAANKAYVDALASGIATKAACRVATTITIVMSGLQSVDGVSLSAGDRVLVKNQIVGAQNGIYVVAVGSWVRATDANTSAEVTSGLYTFVEFGTTQASTGWILTTLNPIILDTTSLVFQQFSGAGQIEAGAGLVKTGNVLNVVSGDNTNIVIGADTINLAATAVGSGIYGNSGYAVSHITVDSYGRLTYAANRDIFGGTVVMNKIFAGPSSGAVASPTFRTLVLNDVLPGLVTTPVIVSQGHLLIGNGANFTQGFLTPDLGISVVTAAGSITIKNTGVLSVTGAINQITVNNLLSLQTGVITLAFPITGVILPSKTTLTASTAVASSLYIPSGIAVTTPVIGDFWLIGATGLWSYYNGAVRNFADLNSPQPLINKTLTNPSLDSILAGAITDTSGLFLSSGKMVTRTLVPGAFTTITFTGTANRLTVGGTSLAPTFDIHTSYVGQSTITTLGTITAGTWGPTATPIGVTSGGTGNVSYTDGQLLIGNSTSNTLTKSILTQGNNIIVTNGGGSITIGATDIVALSKVVTREPFAGPGASFVLGRPPLANSECVFVNGILQTPGAGNDYILAGQTITMQGTSVLVTGDTMQVNYIAS